mgnify:CR=1 FL=1
MSAAVICIVPSSRRRPWPQVVPVPGQPLIMVPESAKASIAPMQPELAMILDLLRLRLVYRLRVSPVATLG